MSTKNIKTQIEVVLNNTIFSGANNFIIGSFNMKTDDEFSLSGNESIKALGSILNPQINMGYKLTGEWQTVPKFGKQFKFSSFQTIEPVSENGIFNYIVRICKFVGPKVGGLIIKEFGTESLNMMREKPEYVASSINGITPERAIAIQKTLLENQNQEKIMVDLEALLDIPGMPKNIIEKLIEKYKSNAVETVKTKPYTLMDFRGVSFTLADRVALQNGTKPGSIERKKAVAIHCMQETMRDGNTWIENDDLINNMKNLVPVKDLSDGIQELLIDKKFVSKMLFSENLLHPCEYYAFDHVDQAENLIVERVCHLLGQKYKER